MRAIILLMLFLVVPCASQASDKTRAAAVSAAQKMIEDAYLYLGVSYLCQNTLGTSHYHAARVAVEQTAMLAGKSEDDAILLAEAFDERVKKDVSPAKHPDDTKCLDQIITAQTSLRVAQAKFRKAASADK